MQRLPLRVTWVLVLALVVQLCAVGYYATYLRHYGYLPSPFVYDKSDTFMDLYNTLWWAGDDGRYSVWGSVYPPLNFLILKVIRVLSYPNLQIALPAELRQLQLGPAIFLCALHLLAPFVVVSFPGWKIGTPAFRIAVAVVVAISPPLLFSMERGNLIIICLFLLPFVFDEKSNVRTVAIALLINIKPYFAVLLFGFLIAGDIRRFLQATAFAGAIFIFTGLALDANFPLFLTNLIGFAQNDTVLSGREVLALPSSISAFSHTLDTIVRSSTSPRIYVNGVTQLSTAIELVKTTALLATLTLVICARRHLSAQEIMVALLAIVVNAGVWVGGYSQIFYFACIPVFFGMRLRTLHIALVAMMFMPLDLITLANNQLNPSWAYLSNSIVDVVWQIGLGSLIRPMLNGLLLFTLAMECIVRISQASPRSTHMRIQYS
ncbi:MULTISPECIES: hypothetical protein [unclassified Rhizobium]